MLVKDIIRQNSLYKLGLSEKPKVLDILDKLKGLKQFKNDRYPNYMFWGNSKKDIYIEQNLKNNDFFVSYEKIWAFLTADFGLNYADVQLLTQWYIETAFNLKGVTTLAGSDPSI